MDVVSILDGLRVYLPIQYPLGVFIHNNMLMAFEDRPFAQGVAEASRMFGARRSMDESYYQAMSDRIRDTHLQTGLTAWRTDKTLPETLAGKSVTDILKALLDKPLIVPHRLSSQQITHAVARLNGFVPESPHRLTTPNYSKGKAWKTVFLRETGEDPNTQFLTVFIRFLGSYIDQGMATWHNPDTHLGLWESFRGFVASNHPLGANWIHKVHQDMQANPQAEEWLKHWLTHMPFKDDASQYLLHTLLELRGWAGMVNKCEKESHLMPRHAPKIKLLDYVAIFLVMENAVYEQIRTKHNLRGTGLEEVEAVLLNDEQLLYVLAHVSQAAGIDPSKLNSEDLRQLLEMTVSFDTRERAKIWHDAFDLSVRDECLGALQAVRQNSRVNSTAKPDAKVYLCIDDREESLRRHIEEVNPSLETFGVVGFFGLDMKFKSADHPEAVNQCPPVINASRTIEEVVQNPNALRNQRRNWGRGNTLFYHGTRAGLESQVYTLLTGPLMSMILLLRVFFPTAATRLKKWLRSKIVDSPATTIQFNATQGAGGYQIAEMAGIVAMIMRFAGSTKDFSPLHFMIAHGATSTNNPYKNAYGCGACSGKAGIPNSRIFCGMANDLVVRAHLREHEGIDIPDATFFVSCYHDTSTDEILCFNQAEVPPHLQADCLRLLGDLRKAAAFNSRERCRMFSSARHMKNPQTTLRHVRSRAASLAEPRPEYGHTNNAMCVIGRRSLTKDLYLDRRSFLTSYDASIDPDGKILAQVMAGAVPVAGGINLDYYFSRVDNEVYGSGTKLPLNVVGLLGVMTGSGSDLRIGLARQMVELHEPVRISIVIEADPAIVQKILDAAPRQKRLVHNGWLHMAIIHPVTGEMYLHNGTSFVLYNPPAVDLKVLGPHKEYMAHHGGSLPFALLPLVGA